MSDTKRKEQYHTCRRFGVKHCNACVTGSFKRIERRRSRHKWASGVKVAAVDF